MTARSEQINELATALAKAQARLMPVAKTNDNPFFKSKYADLAACVRAAAPVLSENGLSVCQLPSSDASGGVSVESVLLHASGQWMSSTITTKPAKSDAQALGSTVTYLRRYGYCALIGLAAENEDDDGNGASGNEPHGKTDSQKQHSQYSKPDPQEPKAKPEPKAEPKDEPKFDAKVYRDKMIKTLVATKIEQPVIVEYARKAEILMENEGLLDWPVQWIPHTKEHMEAIIGCLKKFANGEAAEKPTF